MPNSDSEGRDLVSQTGKTPNTVGPIPTVDLSFLPEDKRAQLIEDYAKGIIEIDKKARELQIETGVLKNTLDTMTRTAKNVELARAPLPAALDRRGDRRLLHRTRRQPAGARLRVFRGRAWAAIGGQTARARDEAPRTAGPARRAASRP